MGIKAGKICEVVYSIVQGKIIGPYPATPSKPPNMVDDCKKLEPHNKVHGRSLCIQIPRLLVAAYELRNNRAIGHVGGDVDPNHMDAELLMRTVQWIVAELVRVFGKLSIDDAKALVESLTERVFPVVWVDGDERRVLNPSLGYPDQVLVLLYTFGNAATVEQLLKWTELKKPNYFRDDVLRRLHLDAFIHVSGEVVKLLPPGVREVERRGLLLMPG